MITQYDPSYAARARDLCMLGCSEVEIAKILGLSIGMLRAWRARYDEFDMAWNDGCAIADAQVVAALFKRAIGYDKIKWKETKDGIMQELVHVEGNVNAQMFWLTNKRPEQWRKTEPDALPPPINNGLENMSDIEAARRVAFALSKALYEQGRRLENGSAGTTEPEAE